jgi:hypothetical protein
LVARTRTCGRATARLDEQTALTLRARRWFALLACFFLSGFAALLYQIAWTREFSAVFGTSELAVATVLAAYMGGLASGSTLAGRLSPRVRQPVLVYGLLEFGIAVAALAVPLAIRAAIAVEVALLGGRELPADAGGLASALFYLLCAFAILLVPTTFMGATLPLLARHAVRSDREVGPRIGALYAINTTGALGGTLVCGFVLLPALGLRATVWVGVALNALVFVLAAAVARSAPESVAAAGGARTGDEAAAPLAHAARILPIVLLSGAASFSYEVLWTRLLGHVLGGSIYAFATMRRVLVGIAAGGAIERASRRLPRAAQLRSRSLRPPPALEAFRALDSSRRWLHRSVPVLTADWAPTRPSRWRSWCRPRSPSAPASPSQCARWRAGPPTRDPRARASTPGTRSARSRAPCSPASRCCPRSAMPEPSPPCVR